MAETFVPGRGQVQHLALKPNVQVKYFGPSIIFSQSSLTFNPVIDSTNYHFNQIQSMVVGEYTKVFRNAVKHAEKGYKGKSSIVMTQSQKMVEPTAGVISLMDVMGKSL